MKGTFRFSFGPWNIHEGADPFGPKVRESVPFNRKLALYRKLGFGAVQFHDDDAVPGMNRLSPARIVAQANIGASPHSALILVLGGNGAVMFVGW